MIAPGLREPPTAVTEREARGARRVRPAGDAPAVSGLSAADRDARRGVWARYCVGCHVIDGDGGIGRPGAVAYRHASTTRRRCASWIVDPEAVKPDTDMPAFGKRLSPQQLDAIAQYLASRK